MKKLAIALVLMLTTLANAYLITSAGRDFPTTYTTTPGNWHYEALFNNGTVQIMKYKSTAPTYWSDESPAGNGLISNASATYKALPGITLFIQRGEIAAPRTSDYNASVNWSSNFTGAANISGWYQNWGTPFGYQYNVTIYKNNAVIYSNAVGIFVTTNFTYNVLAYLQAGDNVSFTLGANDSSVFPAINATVYITDYPTIEIIRNAPSNNIGNMTLVTPFGFTPSLINYSIDGFVNASVWTNITGWLPIGNSSAINNNTLNWINVTFPRHGQYLWAVQVCSVVTGCNSTSNYTVNLTAPRLYVQAFDTVSLGRIYFNAQLSNGTNTTTFSNLYWLNKTFGEIPTSSTGVTVQISNASYYTSAYSPVLDLNATNDTAFSAYLIPLSNATVHLVQLIVRNVPGSPVQGATVLIQQFIGGVYTTIASGTTDSAGQAAFYLDGLTQYQVVISASGYTTQSNLLVPSGSQYTFTLSASAGGPGYSGAFTDVTYSLSPISLSSYTIAITGTTSTTSALAYTALRLTLGNGTQIFYSNDTTSAGAAITSNVDGTGWNNTNITAILQIKKDGFEEFNFTYYYYIYNFTAWESNASLTGLFNNLATANMSKPMQFTFATLTGVIAATGGWLVSGPIGAGFMFIAVESLWASAGWIDWNLIYLLTLLVMSIILINRF